MNRKRISTAGHFARRHPRLALRLGLFAFRHRAAIKRLAAGARTAAALGAFVRGLAPAHHKPQPVTSDPARSRRGLVQKLRRGIATTGAVLAANRLKRR